MKTAIIKTGFWQDEDVHMMNTDTKLVYLCLLTNPQRDTLPVFRCSDFMLSAYTGYNKDIIQICRQQLIDAGRIKYLEVNGKFYYVFTKQDFVVPTRGHEAQKIYDREFSKLPIEVQNCINNLYENTTGGTTGDSTSVNTNTNTNSNNKYSEQAEYVFSELQRIFKQPTIRFSTYKEAITNVLKEPDWTPENIIAAATALSKSKYHQGENEQKAIYTNVFFLFGQTKAGNIRKLTKWLEISQQEGHKKKDYGF